MNKMIFSILMVLLFNLGLFANHGRVILDITYDEVGSGGTNNIPLRLTNYYDRHAETLDFINSQLENMKLTGKINGLAVNNIRAGEPVMDKNGNYSLVVTYDEVSGPANQQYTITDLYNPVDISRQSVIERVAVIRDTQKINGNRVNDLKIGDLQTLPDGFKVEMTFTDPVQGQMKYHVDDYFDAKKEAYNVVEDRLMNINLSKTVDGTPITNLKLGPINEIPGGYSADLTFDQVGSSGNIKYNIDEFYDAKMKAKDFIHDRIQSILISQTINGDSITNFKPGEITDDVKNGKFTATLIYNGGAKLVLDSFYDPKAKAINELNQKLQTIKLSMKINGTPITNLRVGKIQVL
jgi:hypothetical protein